MAWPTVQNEILNNATPSMKTYSFLSTSATTEQMIALETRLPIKATFITLYALIFFFGITGNALVVRKLMDDDCLKVLL